MKSIGIVRKIDSLGRITLPKEDREILKINEQDLIEMVREGDKITLRKFNKACAICNNKIFENNSIKIENKQVCLECINSIVQLINR